MLANHSSQKERIPLAELGLPWKTLLISLIFLGLSVFIYVGMTYGYIPFLNSRLNQIQNQLENLSREVTPEQQESLINFYSQLYNIQTLEKNHLYISRVFDEFLEKVIYPQVKLNSMNLMAKEGDLKLEGVAVDFQILDNQLAILRSNPYVLNVVLESASQRNLSDGGGVLFSMKIFLNSKLLNTK